MLTESRYRGLIGELRKHAGVHQSAREIISNRLLPRQIDGALSGNDGRKLLIRQATLLTDELAGWNFWKRQLGFEPRLRESEVRRTAADPNRMSWRVGRALAALPPAGEALCGSLTLLAMARDLIGAANVPVS